MKRRLEKAAYRYAYGFARSCQEKYFLMYMHKYVNKHIKYRKESDEYDVLVVVVHSNLPEYDRVVSQLSSERNRLCRYLYDKNREIYARFRTQYAYRLKTRAHHMCDILTDYHDTKIEDADALRDIVSFSLEFQDIFNKSDLTAKTKIHEHWFMRLPIYVPCVTLILLLNLTRVDPVAQRVQIKIGFMFVAYVLSVFLVIVRFHQSVAADTKKICSEIYTKRKNALFVGFVSVEPVER